VPTPVAAPAPEPTPALEPALDEPAEVYAAPVPAASNGGESVPTFDPAAAPTEAAATDAAPAPSGDDAGARLVALSMALSGSSREQIRDHLATAGVADADAVAGEVLAGAGR
jgi:hypothetical protein